jgi:hypothetical protein
MEAVLSLKHSPTRAKRKVRKRLPLPKLKIDPARLANGDAVLSFEEWRTLNHLPERSARRILKSERGPEFIMLGANRFGVTVRANKSWQQSRIGTRG